MKSRLRRLLKFRELRPSKRVRLLAATDVPRKFAKIFSRTSYYLRKANVAEKRSQGLTRQQLQGYILAWAREVLGIIDIDIEIRGKLPDETQPVLFVGNHISYMDIPLLFASVPVVFVSKEEVSKWFIIGPASKKAGTVFVKRESAESRAKTADAIANAILNEQKSVAVFPSGTTTLDEQKPWRSGAFKIAHAHGFPVQPFRLTYKPLRQLAYIDADFFPVHLWNVLACGKQIKAVIEFGPVQKINDPAADAQRLQSWCQEIHNA